MSLIAALVGGSVVKSIGKVLFKQVGKMLMAAASEKFIEWFLFELLEQMAKSTKTPVDDEMLAKLKEAYYDKAPKD